MKLILTDENQQWLERARRSVGMIYPSLPALNTNAGKVAVVRAAVAHYNRNGTECNAHRILLVKLEEMYARVADEFIITYAPDAWLEFTPFSTLVGKYLDPFRGFGNWSDDALESVVYALIVPRTKNFPAIIHVPTAERLARVYGEQQAAAAKLGEDELPDRIEPEFVERNGLQVPNFAAMARRAERLNARGDSRTNCFRCRAPKPRRCECVVCGYTPRGA